MNKNFKDSFYTLRRPLSSSSTISSWPLISLIESSYSRVNLLFRQPPLREYPAFFLSHRFDLGTHIWLLYICSPQSLLSGMNRFLASLEITFRRDPTNFRPRVNKKNSIKDREQKGSDLSIIFSQFRFLSFQFQLLETTSSSRIKKNRIARRDT
jgi:hypothetical protein